MGQIKNIKLHIVTDTKVMADSVVSTQKKIDNRTPKKKKKLKIKASSNKKEEDASDVEIAEDEVEGLFNVEDVLYFGGEKEDYEQLLNIDADTELETGQGDDDSESAKLRNEIQNLLSSG